MNNVNHILLSILSKDLFFEEIPIMKETPISNKITNYLLEVCNFKYSRKSVNNTKIKSEFVHQEIKDDFADFINASLRKKKQKYLLKILR